MLMPPPPPREGPSPVGSASEVLNKLPPPNATAPPPAAKPNVAPTMDSPSPEQRELVPKKPPPPPLPSPEAPAPKPPPAKMARLDAGADD
eukprot:6530243-Pyramimonas_sp.AAC.1